MTVSLSQINNLSQQVSDPAFDFSKMDQIKTELAAFQAQPHDDLTQKAIDQTRVKLEMREDQLKTASTVNSLYQTLIQFRGMLSSKPVLTKQDYTTLTQTLDTLRTQAEILCDSDFFNPNIPKARYIELLDSTKLALQKFNPDNWKKDWLAYGIILISVTLLFGYAQGSAAAGKACLVVSSAIALTKGKETLMQKFTQANAAQKQTPPPTPALTPVRV